LTRSLRLVLLSLIAVAAAMAAAAAFVLVEGRFTRPEAATAGGDVGGPFTLTDQDGRRVTEADLRGRPSLVFFGFTNCPDVCPTALFTIAEAMKIAGLTKTDLVPVFISVDPERDTPETLKAFAGHFSPDIVALTGSPAEIDAVVKGYKAYAKKVEAPESGLGYLVDHSAFAYLMDANGRFIRTFAPSGDPGELAAKLKAALGKTS
jgi:protein SCO1